MRVVLDATALGSGRGGDETHLRGLLAGLDACARPGDVFPLVVRHDAPPTGLDAGRFPVVPIRRRAGLVHYAVGRRGALVGEARRADAVHSITHAPIASPLPVALTVCDLSFRHHPELYPAGARTRLNTLVARQARAARVVCTLTDFCRDDLIDSYGLAPERVQVVPCAVEPHRHVTPEERARAEAWLDVRGVRRPYLLYLGNLHPRKNVVRLIQAFDRVTRSHEALRGLDLVLAGGRWWRGGPEGDAAAAVRHGSVIELGRVSDEVRRVLLEDALALAYVSIFEGFGLPPVEAMAAGTPVLASDRSAIPEVCGAAALLVDPLDVDAIACGIERIVTDDTCRAELSSMGRKRAERYEVRRTGGSFHRALARVANPSSN